MKTTNNVQKTILKSVAVVVSFVLISFTVSAQDFWISLLENSTFNEIALAMVESNSETNEVSTDANAFVALLDIETEDALELEDWMTNETNFSTTFSIEEEIESPLALEDWMTDNTYFPASSLSIEIETEAALEVESWMIDENNFAVKDNFNKVRNFALINESDSELELETWITDDKIWNN